ncbi:osmoprotectant transport system substrate-binding protein [Alkalihalobacillus xiaoxiensis]|uniref:Osmoprotectant transport system substrate-binding protein n=1 Tax=Shouchella xiaoxiensis TaxID=766895 RepID=A0ABS2T022_9BACI|nr:glycine betaine ABC transporter substrate-binding protein [Shouchella xiaoxiensis]MBM7841118.1 osmoprotectant transport system substrate-binding protein [Shouchella xiaoxiensis]
MKKSTKWLTGSVAFVSLSLSGCGYLGFGDSITIGAKSFTEQYILSEMTYFILEDAGYQVRQVENLGSNVLRSALENGQVDITWEYTGTAIATYLNMDPITDPDEAYSTLQEVDPENGLHWMNVSEVNNTYALIMNRAEAEDLGISSLSDLATYVNDNPGELNMGTDAAFANRADGLPGLEQTYGFEFGSGNVDYMDAGLLYEALYNGELSVAMGYETDARIDDYDQVILEDDEVFFAPYNAAVSIRLDVFEENPEIEELLQPLADLLDSEIMRGLNYEVDIERQSVTLVAYNFLVEAGLIEEDE